MKSCSGAPAAALCLLLPLLISGAHVAPSQENEPAATAAAVKPQALLLNHLASPLSSNYYHGRAGVKRVCIKQTSETGYATMGCRTLLSNCDGVGCSECSPETWWT